MWGKLTSCSMFGASARYSLHESDATGDKTTPQAQFNVAEGWSGLEQVNTSWTLGAYGGYTEYHAVLPAMSKYSKSGSRWLINAGVSLGFISDGLWLVGSYGNATGSTTALNDKQFSLSLALSPPKASSLFTTAGNGSRAGRRNAFAAVPLCANTGV